MARDHTAGGQVEPRAARLGELLRRWLSRQSVPGARQLHSRAVAPVVALQAQGQGTQGRDISTLAPLRALRSRTPDRAWVQRAVGEGVTSCPRAGCGNLHVRFEPTGLRVTFRRSVVLYKPHIERPVKSIVRRAGAGNVIFRGMPLRNVVVPESIGN